MPRRLMMNQTVPPATIAKMATPTATPAIMPMLLKDEEEDPDGGEGAGSGGEGGGGLGALRLWTTTEVVTGSIFATAMPRAMEAAAVSVTMVLTFS